MGRTAIHDTGETMEKSNYDRAVEIYEKTGQSGVFDEVLNGGLFSDSWHLCEPCECMSPHENNICLVCGTQNKKNDPAKLSRFYDINPNLTLREFSQMTGLSVPKLKKILLNN
jgi:hypothetical protein